MSVNLCKQTPAQWLECEFDSIWNRLGEVLDEGDFTTYLVEMQVDLTVRPMIELLPIDTPLAMDDLLLQPIYSLPWTVKEYTKNIMRG